MSIKTIKDNINFIYEGLNVICKKIENDEFKIYTEGGGFTFLFKFENEQNIIYKYNININKFNAIENIIIVYRLCRELLSGQFQISDMISLKYKITNENRRNMRSVEFMISYWEKFLKLEKHLKTKFNINNIVTDKFANFTMNRLYTSVILNKPYRVNNVNIKTLTMQTEKFLSKEEQIKLLDKLQSYKLIQQDRLQLGGENIPIYIVIGVFNLLILKIEYEKEINTRREYILYPNQYNGNMYLCEKIFLNKDDAYKYLNSTNSMKELKEAAPI